ncbi:MULTISPECIES: Tn3 family transposase [Polaromonas]|uniref:Tn3 family transposase n=1 Tax=Polaromonas aquatica TaxID=332657 RepID=A0ABW1TRR2_9BURK
MTAQSRRLSILTAEEIEELYGLPCFTEDERCRYFELSPIESEAVGAVRTVSAAAHLALQLGYFKAKQQFFVYELEVIRADLDHILRRHFPGRELGAIGPFSKPTRLVQQRLILQLFVHHPCDGAAKDELERKAQRFAMLSTQPIYILREVLQHLANRRTVAPGYTYLQDLVSRAVTGERKRITQLLDQALPAEVQLALDELLQADDGTYRISTLKHEPKDFSNKQLRQEVARRKRFGPLHEFAQTFLATTGLSNESVKYFASLVQFYTVYKLRRMALPTVRLYLLCFAYHRLRQINDNLVEAFIHLVDQYEEAAKRAAEEAAQKTLLDVGEHLKAAGQVLNLFVDPAIPAQASFAQVKAQAFSLLEPAQFPVVSNYMCNIEFDKIGFEWDYYTAQSMAFKRNLRHLFADLEFAGRVEDAPLLEALVFLQDLLRRGVPPSQINRDRFPDAVIPKGLRRYLFTPPAGKGTPKRLLVDRYEFLVYRLVRNALEAGDVYVKNSNEFRRFEDDLISDARWKNKNAVLREIGAPLLMAPIEESLASLRETLEAKFASVNQRIDSGENKHIKLTGRADNRRWTLIYPSEDEPTNSPFYGQLSGIGIADLLWFVAGKTGFLKSCTHVLDRYVKQAPDPRALLACIVAMGTNMGLWKMAEVCGISHASLETTARNFLRGQTLHAANDAICNATAALPAFHFYDIHGEVHSSSDGQRMETQINTINARYSSKYFGLKKGVSAYTLVANHVPINAKIIGTHEHESHYVFDLLHNNTTQIRPARHSTDTHGTNQVNFWLLHAFGYRFAPRYRDLHKKIGTLVGFENPKHYGDHLIKPARKVYEELIVKEWPNIQRIMASLAQKDVTQATIVRKLASYARQNQTKKALWELDNICRTLHIVNFIDDVQLRQRVQKALNRGEAYHRFRRAIAYVNAGKFRVKTEGEQQIWNECSRLIANAVIFYNTALLSRVYEQKLAAGDLEAAELVKKVSPVAWQHVNLFGSFEFSDTESGIDLDALAAQFADPNYWRSAMQDDAADEGQAP